MTEKCDTEAHDGAGSAVTAIGLKFPPYWPGDPGLWFAQVEAQFLTRSITRQDTKFAHVISSLQSEVAQEVMDFIIDPPAQDRYDKLRQRTGVSEQKRIHQLLTAEELGDRKPTQLLRRMKQLLGDSTLEDSILKQLFLQRLPNNVRIILASSSDAVPIEQLAELADKILEVAVPSHHVSAVLPTLLLCLLLLPVLFRLHMLLLRWRGYPSKCRS
ncbi:uncharacterized protein LOC135153207 [Lytechinus pictus]|uniref:uncharacterized protein LOC135153207 n=1 Tax=Lytechinus pictus TaxID=7653 RepID=UPI0030B9E911